MNNAAFWNSIHQIIADGFTSEGLQKLDEYAELFIRRKLLYQRFSSKEQYGCAAGGITHAIATLLAGAEDCSDPSNQGRDDFKSQCQRGEKQAKIIEQWAKKIDLWIESIDEVFPQMLGTQIAEGGEAVVFDHGDTLIKVIGLDYFVEPILALDRITLHNTYFPETGLSVICFGRDTEGNFKIIVEQPFIKGERMTDHDIEIFMERMGFNLINRKNWTYATPDIYLSDMHDENVFTSETGNVFVVDCDIRLNVPALRCGGVRRYSNEVLIVD
jgi:hypothetical protein